MEKYFLLQMLASIAVAVILGMFFKLYSSLVATPRKLRRVLEQQGYGGPPPAFLVGNALEIRKMSRASTTAPAPAVVAHNFGADLYAVFHKWRRQYGDIYTFTLGTTPVLMVNKYDVIKELAACTSLHLGKPLYLKRDFEPLLGNGVTSSNGEFWAFQRKIIAPGLFMDKVKEMSNSIQESAQILIDSWKSLIDGEGGGKADIKIDNYLKNFAGDAISRVCFGSNYGEAEEIFDKMKDLQIVLAKKGFLLAIPGMRYVPTKRNRREWQLQREIRELILKLLREKSGADTVKNMLKMIVEGGESSNMTMDAKENFIVDNCKNILLGGYEPTSIAASWCLVLLASDKGWQDRARQEVLGICKGQLPDFDSLKQMKQLTMVIHEALRLYPPGHIMSRYVLHELEFANIRIPKGVIIWIMTTTLHMDPDIWGPDSYEFKPERFANGITGACKFPHLFMPFGFGPRNCLGQNLAMLELKMLLAHILSNFSFSLSPKYVHSPAVHVHLEPGNGVDLVFKKLKMPVVSS